MSVAGALLLYHVQTTTSANHSYVPLKNLYDLLYPAKLTLMHFECGPILNETSRMYKNYVAYILVILLLLLLLLYIASTDQRFSFHFFDCSKFWKNFIREIGKSCRRRALETDDMSGYHYI